MPQNQPLEQSIKLAAESGYRSLNELREYLDPEVKYDFDRMREACDDEQLSRLIQGN